MAATTSTPKEFITLCSSKEPRELAPDWMTRGRLSFSPSARQALLAARGDSVK